MNDWNGSQDQLAPEKLARPAPIRFPVAGNGPEVLVRTEAASTFLRAAGLPHASFLADTRGIVADGATDIEPQIEYECSGRVRTTRFSQFFERQSAEREVHSIAEDDEFVLGWIPDSDVPQAFHSIGKTASGETLVNCDCCGFRPVAIGVPAIQQK